MAARWIPSRSFEYRGEALAWEGRPNVENAAGAADAGLVMTKENLQTSANSGDAAAAVSVRRQQERLDEVERVLPAGFDLVRSLGSSGSANLFLAYDRRPEPIRFVSPADQVVLKVLSKEAACDPIQVDLFHLEARAAARLSHRNIVNSSEAEAEAIGGLHLCVVEQKPEVETLRERLDRCAWLEVEDAVRILHDVASALEHAHRSGVVHLNIAPENILVDRNDAAFVTGFGIESDRDLGWAERRRSSFLPAQYRSPEQNSGEAPDCRSDLYSAGVVLFEMLSDRTPFDEEDADAMRHKQMTRPAPAAHLFRPDLPDTLSRIAARLLERSPDRRFQTAGELLSALNTLIEAANARRTSVRLLEQAVVGEGAPVNPPSGSPSGDQGLSRDAWPERGEERELIPDEIDLLDLVSDEENGLEFCEQGANVLDLEGAISPSIQSDHADSGGTAKIGGFGEIGRRELFEPPAIEAIAPGVQPLERTEAAIKKKIRLDFRTAPFDSDPAVNLPPSATQRARRLTLAAVTLLCIFALAAAGYVAKTFGPPASSAGSGEASVVDPLEGTRTDSRPQADRGSTSGRDVGPGGGDGLKSAQVGPWAQRRRYPKVMRYDRSRPRSAGRKATRVRRWRR